MEVPWNGCLLSPGGLLRTCITRSAHFMCWASSRPARARMSPRGRPRATLILSIQVQVDHPSYAWKKQTRLPPSSQQARLYPECWETPRRLPSALPRASQQPQSRTMAATRIHLRSGTCTSWIIGNIRGPRRRMPADETGRHQYSAAAIPRSTALAP